MIIMIMKQLVVTNLSNCLLLVFISILKILIIYIDITEVDLIIGKCNDCDKYWNGANIKQLDHVR